MRASLNSPSASRPIRPTANSPGFIASSANCPGTGDGDAAPKRRRAVAPDVGQPREAASAASWPSQAALQAALGALAAKRCAKRGCRDEAIPQARAAIFCRLHARLPWPAWQHPFRVLRGAGMRGLPDGPGSEGASRRLSRGIGESRQAMIREPTMPFEGARDHDLLQATGAVVEPRRGEKLRALCPYDRQPCRYPRCALCPHRGLRALNNALGVGAAVLCGAVFAALIAAVMLALVVLVKDFG